MPVGPWLDWLLTGGFGMIAAPALTVFLWGTSGSAGFLAGLVVYAFLVCLLAPALGAEGGLGRSPAPTVADGLGRSPAPTLSALREAALFGLPLFGLVTLQGTHLLESASQAARNVKIIVLLIALGLALVWSLTRWLSARRAR
jgi:hypothetical protein